MGCLRGFSQPSSMGEPVSRATVYSPDPARLDAAALTSRPVVLCLFGLLFGVALFARCPAKILHPEFWAEDGVFWYADAYTAGWHSLFFPQNGYLQTISRLVALVAQGFPLLWGPGLFVAAALLIQTLTATFLVSARMSTVWLSTERRVLFAFIYLALPNSFETHLNLTNAQWHLAILAFLVLLSRPAESRLGKAWDLAVLALSGLSGPFCLFLSPIAIWQLHDDRSATQLQRATIVAITCIIQGSFLIATIGDSRSAAALGANIGTLAHIAAVQILLGGLLGARVMSRVAHTALLSSDEIAIAIALGGLLLCAVALWRGPPVLRKAAVFGGLVLTAALWRPQVSLTLPQWSVMTNPGAGQRYYLIPILVWIGVALTLAKDRNRSLRYLGSILVLFLLGGIAVDWFHPALSLTNFREKAREFALAPPGTRMEFELHPPGCRMILIKQAP
jgi:hypothetical protein